MITRSDVSISDSIADYGYSMPSYLNTPEDHNMDIDLEYSDPYNSMFFDFETPCDNSSYTSINSKPIQKNYSPASQGGDKYLYPDSIISKERTSKMKNLKASKHLQMSEKDLDFLFFNNVPETLKDDKDPFSYSEPVTPTELFFDTSETDHPSLDETFEDVKENSNNDSLRPTCLERSSYDTTSVMYGNDDFSIFSGLVNCDEVMKKTKKDVQPQAIPTVLSPLQISDNEFLKPTSPDPETNCSQTIINNMEIGDELLIEANDVNTSSNKDEGRTSSSSHDKKAKLTGLQKRALDSIFSITDRPSRGLVLHIATELNLHHIAVKNFFSNGRRRLRRAAARLNDPERTKRENQRRKEKRRLAALAAASNGTEKDAKSLMKVSIGETASDSQVQREPPVLSPERRALMEKLAVKVQRSVAQKGLQQALMSDSNFPTSNVTKAPVVIQQKLVDSNIGCVLTSQIHSNRYNVIETAHQAFSMPLTDNFQQMNGDNLENVISNYEENMHVNSQHSQNHNLTVPYNMNYDDQTKENPIIEEGPFSPFNWQTLLNS